jgi:energy-coupling factor transport system permease protein
MVFETYHPIAWLVWLVAATLPALSTRNPLYLTLDLIAVGVTYAALGRNNALAQSWNAFVRFGIFLWLLTIPFTALTSHHGTIVLFQFPRTWPIIGGAITLESILFGLTSGLSLITLLMAFATFNIAVDQARLLRMTPGFVYQTGVVAGIAVAFVPQMVRSWQSIREAQQVRGHRVRGLRDLLPLMMPLLVTGLERAMQLAESMEARGFGGQGVSGTRRQHWLNQAAILGGLGAVGVGLAGIGFWPQQRWLASLLLAAGVALLLWSFWDQGRRIHRTRYHRWTWNRLDRIVLATSLVAAAGWVAVWIGQPELLFYYPYPPHSPWPVFHPVPGLLLLLVAAPGVLLRPAPASRPARSLER